MLRAVRCGDTAAIAALCAPGCHILLPNGAFGRADGIRRLLATRCPSGSGVSGAEPDPEHVGHGHVLVPLTIDMPIGDHSVQVQATAVWTVHDGLVTGFRSVPGDRRHALVELGLLSEPPPGTAIGPNAVRTTWRGHAWANVAGFEVLEHHPGKHAAIAAGRRHARERRVEHVIERQDGTVALVEGRHARHNP